MLWTRGSEGATGKARWAQSTTGGHRATEVRLEQEAQTQGREGL